MEHSLKKFDVELDDLRINLGRMGELVVGQIDDAMRALAAHDIGAARTTIEHDLGVNRMDIEIEDQCLRLLALHQPVANDLRVVAAALKIATELERIGDRAVNICEAIHAPGEQDPIESHTEISKMGDLVTAMVRAAIASFLRTDASQAKQVIEKDKEFDALYSAALPRLMAFTNQNPQGFTHEAKLAFLAKDVNELSEHATNIAELVIFMVEGKEITHMDMHERRAAR
jgi:phosphate transport system protein